MRREAVEIATFQKEGPGISSLGTDHHYRTEIRHQPLRCSRKSGLWIEGHSQPTQSGGGDAPHMVDETYCLIDIKLNMVIIQPGDILLNVADADFQVRGHIAG